MPKRNKIAKNNKIQAHVPSDFIKKNIKKTPRAFAVVVK